MCARECAPRLWMQSSRALACVRRGGRRRTGDVSMRRPPACQRSSKAGQASPQQRGLFLAQTHPLVRTSIERSIEKRRKPRIQTESWGLFLLLDTAIGLCAAYLSRYSCCRSTPDAEHRSERIRWEEMDSRKSGASGSRGGTRGGHGGRGRGGGGGGGRGGSSGGGEGSKFVIPASVRSARAG